MSSANYFRQERGGISLLVAITQTLDGIECTECLPKEYNVDHSEHPGTSGVGSVTTTPEVFAIRLNFKNSFDSMPNKRGVARADNRTQITLPLHVASM